MKKSYILPRIIAEAATPAAACSFQSLKTKALIFEGFRSETFLFSLFDLQLTKSLTLLLKANLSIHR
jgi:hypothetical protein